MIQSVFVYQNEKVENLTSARLAEAVKKGFVWVDVEKPSKEDFDLLQKHLPLHPLACDPVFEAYPRAKAMDFGEHLLIVFHEPIKEEKGSSFARIIFFLGQDFLVTLHDQSLPSVDSLKEILQSNSMPIKKGPSFLAYSILDRIVDSYFPVLETLDDRMDSLENSVFLHNGEKKTLKEIFALKREILEMKRRISPEREVLSVLSRHDLRIIDAATLIYFRDVYDHTIRLSDMIDTYRDLLTSILDVYISMQSNRMNEVMKVLTVIATIFMPLTVIVGFYGMNIVFPEVNIFGENTYYLVWGIMLFALVLMGYYFKKKKWF